MYYTLKIHFMSRSCTFIIKNEMIDRNVIVCKHIAYQGRYKENHTEMDLIQPQKYGSFYFETYYVFYGCSGVLALSVRGGHGTCEFVVAIAIRNSMNQIRKISRSKFAATVLNESKEVNEETYCKLINGVESTSSHFALLWQQLVPDI